MSTVMQTISGTSTTGAEVRSRADKSQDSITMSPRKGLARIAVFLCLAMTLYILLKHAHKSVARAMVVLVALSTGVSCLNVVFEFEGLRVATDSAYAAA